MKSSGPDWLDSAEGIVDQLLKFTAQFAEIEQDPGVNARALADACGRRLEDLKQLLPNDLSCLREERNELLEKLRELYGQTQVCLKILEKKSVKAGTKVHSLTKTKRALGAYGKPLAK